MPNKKPSPQVDEEIAGHILWLWLNTDLNQAQIAAQLGALNQGRVSEVINGHRFAKAVPIEYVGDINAT